MSSLRRWAVVWLLCLFVRFVVRLLRFLWAREHRISNLLTSARNCDLEVRQLRRALVIKTAELLRTKQDLEVINISIALQISVAHSPA